MTTTAFGYLDPTSSLQQQPNNKQPSGSYATSQLNSEVSKGDYARLWGLFHYFIDRNLRNLRE